MSHFFLHLLLPCFFILNGVESNFAVTDTESKDVIEPVLIDTNKAYEMYKNGAVFIDLRSQVDWKIGHIRNAIHMDIKREFNDLYRIHMIDRNKEIVIYCNSTECSRSSVVNYIANAWGFHHVYQYDRGFFAWIAADLPYDNSST